jgi:membrane protease YdiL (CAAX protease family)
VVSIAVWTVGGVAVHDAVIAPLVVLVGVLLVPRLPSWSRAPVAAGLIVLLSVTLLAIPVIGRFGERPDVPSLLDRPYGLLWLVFALVVTFVAVVACLLRRRTTHRAGGS